MNSIRFSRQLREMALRKQQTTIRVFQQTAPSQHYLALLNFFKQRDNRFYCFITGFIGSYIYFLYSSCHSKSELVRLGAAGSLTGLLAESPFYFIDAINAKSKVLERNMKFSQMFKHIVKTDGILGLFKGCSASFYSLIISGYLYFYIYKGTKVFLKDKFHPSSTSMLAAIYLSASMISEIISLFIYYPFELVKVRILTKNDKFQYYSASDGFRKIIKEQSFPGIYKGLNTYFFAFMG